MGPREIMLPAGQVSERSVNSFSEALFNYHPNTTHSRLIKSRCTASKKIGPIPRHHTLTTYLNRYRQTGTDPRCRRHYTGYEPKAHGVLPKTMPEVYVLASDIWVPNFASILPSLPLSPLTVVDGGCSHGTPVSAIPATGFNSRPLA